MGNVTNEQQPAGQGRGVGELPCAFCGSAPGYHTHGGVWRQHHVFYCPTVDCPAHRNVRDAPSASCGEGYSYPTKDEALAAWNKRDAAIAALSLPRQSEAGRVFYVLESFTEGVGGSYWCGNTWFNFSGEIEKAIQYCRRRDAEHVMFEKWRLGSDIRVTEHMMITTPQPAQADTTPAVHGVSWPRGRRTPEGWRNWKLDTPPRETLIHGLFEWGAADVTTCKRGCCVSIQGQDDCLLNGDFWREVDYKHSVQAASAPGGES